MFSTLFERMPLPPISIIPPVKGNQYVLMDRGNTRLSSKLWFDKLTQPPADALHAPTLLITHHFFKRFHKKSSFFLKLFAQFKKIV